MSTGSPPIGSIIAGKYRLIGMLGQGGMGSVYDAVNDAVGRRVAIKFLDPALIEHPEFARRFELEARAAAVIGHPDIVDVLDMGRTDEGVPFIVMEHLAGITARALHKATPNLPPAIATAVIVPVLDALAAAHAAGVVHRDLKPANIFLVVKPRPGVKVLDFGISKFGASDGTGLTRTGTTLGTPAYMAPEQLRSGRSASPASDLYAVGATLYALLAGRPPFEADSDYALVAQVLTEPHLPLAAARPDLPPGLLDVVEALLEKDPARRPADAEAVKALLLEVCPPDVAGLSASAAALVPARSSSSDAVPRPSAGRGRTMASPGRSRPPPPPVPAPEVEDPTPRDVPVHAAPPSRRGLFITAAVVAVVLVAVIVVALSSVERPVELVAVAPEPTVMPSTPAAKPAPPEPVTVTVAFVPPTAQVTLGDGGVRCNPCTLTQPKGTALKAVANAAGFQPAAVDVDFSEARTVSVDLVALGPARPGTSRGVVKAPVLGPNAKVIVVGDAPAPVGGAMSPMPAPPRSSFGVVNPGDDVLREARERRARGDSAGALQMMQEELERTQAGQNRAAEAHALRNMANFQLDLGRCNPAEDAYLRALQVFESMGDLSAAGLVANDLGLMGKRCPMVNGPQWLEKAVTTLKAARDYPGVRKAANNLGVEYLNRGQSEKARQAFDEALKAAAALGDHAGMARVRANLVLAWLFRDGSELRPASPGTPEFDEAKAQYQAGVASAKRAGQAERVVCDYLGDLKGLCPSLRE
ncbi:MAG: tetratricopeptide repeat-containing serine/threonine protein kinase [Myxococcaceae bacterium]|nr:tetratricopeptide repeat-containing serine/threonine protein kinase [Myxococcaceae bacterium]